MTVCRMKVDWSVYSFAQFGVTQNRLKWKCIDQTINRYAITNKYKF